MRNSWKSIDFSEENKVGGIGNYKPPFSTQTPMVKNIEFLEERRESRIGNIYGINDKPQFLTEKTKFKDIYHSFGFFDSDSNYI